MSRAFEELARTDTPLGEIVLRRRLEPISRRDIFEVILADDGLMSSLFTHGEEQLAELGLAAVTAGSDCGDTRRRRRRTRARLHRPHGDPRVRTMHVVDTLDVGSIGTSVTSCRSAPNSPATRAAH
jgi:hypothetical protein